MDKTNLSAISTNVQRMGSQFSPSSFGYKRQKQNLSSFQEVYPERQRIYGKPGEYGMENHQRTKEIAQTRIQLRSLHRKSLLLKSCWSCNCLLIANAGILTFLYDASFPQYFQSQNGEPSQQTCGKMLTYVLSREQLIPSGR